MIEVKVDPPLIVFFVVAQKGKGVAGLSLETGTKTSGLLGTASTNDSVFFGLINVGNQYFLCSSVQSGRFGFFALCFEMDKNIHFAF